MSSYVYHMNGDIIMKTTNWSCYHWHSLFQHVYMQSIYSIHKWNIIHFKQLYAHSTGIYNIAQVKWFIYNNYNMHVIHAGKTKYKNRKIISFHCVNLSIISTRYLTKTIIVCGSGRHHIGTLWNI